MNVVTPQAPLDRTGVRPDFLLIADMVESGSRLLDVGCGDGALLDHLARFNQVKGRGIELNQQRVNTCVSQGLSVIQGNADTDLIDYPDNAFDYVVLSRTLQATHNPRHVLEQLVRIGRRAIVSFQNFGHWQFRLSLLFGGRMPVTRSLPDRWYSTPNIHLCTISDFLSLCQEANLSVEQSIALDASGNARRMLSMATANLFAEQAMFLLCKR